MNIVQAVWEKRNLNVDCCEITVASDDSVEEMAAGVSQHETEYTVLRLPTNRMDLLTNAQDMGYRFIETATQCYHTGQAFNLNPIQQRIVDRITWRPMDNAGLAKMHAEIRKGMFSTDRVSIDPKFSFELSNERYIFWISDEVARGGRIYEVNYKDRSVGFFTLRRKDEEVEIAFLSGVYEEFRTSGFGFCCHYCEVTEGVQPGASRVETIYSSNNRGAAAVHLSMGHVLMNQHHILIKHL